jgi:hypothetical protein
MERDSDETVEAAERKAYVTRRDPWIMMSDCRTDLQVERQPIRCWNTLTHGFTDEIMCCIVRHQTVASRMPSKTWDGWLGSLPDRISGGPLASIVHVWP